MLLMAMFLLHLGITQLQDLLKIFPKLFFDQWHTPLAVITELISCWCLGVWTLSTSTGCSLKSSPTLPFLPENPSSDKINPPEIQLQYQVLWKAFSSPDVLRKVMFLCYTSTKNFLTEIYFVLNFTFICLLVLISVTSMVLFIFNLGRHRVLVYFVQQRRKALMISKLRNVTKEKRKVIVEFYNEEL